MQGRYLPMESCKLNDVWNFFVASFYVSLRERQSTQVNKNAADEEILRANVLLTFSVGFLCTKESCVSTKKRKYLLTASRAASSRTLLMVTDYWH